jgi:hypothetical protein
MAKLLSTRNIMIAGGVGAALYLFPRTVAKVNPIQYVLAVAVPAVLHRQLSFD